MMRESDAVVHIRKGEARSLKAGGAWIYDNEIDSIEGEYEDGDLVTVLDFDGYHLGYGFINRHSKIRIRMLSRYLDHMPNRDFMRERLAAAWDYRKRVMYGGNDLLCPEAPYVGDTGRADLNACRIIFGEADNLPGLVVDKYSDYLVVESLALGIDLMKEMLLTDLIEILAADGITIRAIYERSDAPVRRKEGMQPYKGLLYFDGRWMSEEEIALQQTVEGRQELSRKLGFDPHVEIIENGVHYLIDVENGQKTGFFLDQKYNRLALQRLCTPSVRVLDCFTHMGTFALNAGLAGAYDVTGLDISEFAVEQARANAKLNGLSDRVHFRCANVLDELPRLIEAGELYDVVIVDPPAFTKSREATKNAIKGYREVNMKGMKLVKDGGYYCTCSCSHFMTEELLKKTVREAARAVHKRLRQIEFRTQSADHPILWAADESYYLKFMIFQLVEEK